MNWIKNLKTEKEETTMERKIGEVFEYNGEWYQCIVGNSCEDCAFNKRKCYTVIDNGDPIGDCCADRRTDNKDVIFKKLEKVGEPYSDYCPSGRVIYFQRYRCFQKPIYNGDFIYWSDDISISIEIKQNEKDVKEINNPNFSNTEKIGKNLKPFDLQAAKSGKPVCTRDGRKARIICFDSKNDPRRPIVALVEHNDNELLYEYTIEGKERFSHISTTGTSDLMMLPEKKEGWVNVYRDCNGMNITKDDNIYSSKEAAIASAQIIDRDNYVATTIINWEE